MSQASAEQWVSGDVSEEFSQGHPAHGLQSQTSNMGFSTPYPMVLLLFTIFPVGHRKEIGKVRRLRENAMDKARGAPV